MFQKYLREGIQCTIEMLSITSIAEHATEHSFLYVFVLKLTSYLITPKIMLWIFNNLRYFSYQEIVLDIIMFKIRI